MASEWWQRLGSVAQMVSAAGAIAFGVGSIRIANNVYSLQEQTRKDAELGRTNDLLMKYQSELAAYENDFFHGGSCISYVTSISGRPEFDSMGKTDNKSQYTFSEKILEIDKNSAYLSACLETDTVKAPFQTFNKRMNIMLNLFESVLTGWKYLGDEAKNEITAEIHDDICNSPPKSLFIDAYKNAYIKDKIGDEFPNLALFVSDRCK